MSDESKAVVDSVRTLNVLWGTQRLPRRGPKHALTTPQIVRAAVEIADAHGDLADLSMRVVAESLGAGTMSLYTYVASRDELVALMVDLVYGEAVRDLAERSITSWQDGLRAVADVNRSLLAGHRWLLQIFSGRPALGPNALAKYDAELAVIDGIGLTDVEMDSTLNLVLNHVEGVARGCIRADQVARTTGVTDRAWWDMIAPAFAQVFDVERFPIAARVGEAAGQAHQGAYSPEHAYMFGLDMLIDGIAAKIPRPPRSRKPSTPPPNRDSH